MAKNTNKTKQVKRLEDLELISYDELIKEVRKDIGKRPKMPNSLPKGVWTEQALKVLGERYLIKDKNGNPKESPEQMCWRVAWDVASAESRWGAAKKQIKETAVKFYGMLLEHSFLPNSPTLMNAGTGNGLQYSACFVLPVDDSMEGIFDALKYQAIIHKTGGGTGFSFSRLRESGARVKKSQGVASGPVSFMRIFDAATNEVKQGGKRRGANMGILRVDHPDILEFIHCKEEGGITNFNISVGITDAFMDAYKNDTDYELIEPHTGKVVDKLSAKKVFNEIADGAWRTGDPGLIFLDRINAGTANPVPSLGPVESTNPCGEQPLYPFDSCNLGSIFLNYFVKETKGKKSVDWEKLKQVTSDSVRFLDNVIEMNPYPLEQIKRISLGIRRIGLGVGGWADLLIELEIPYDSEKALRLGEKIMKTIQDEAIKTSEKLATERGAFPLWGTSIYKDDKPRRNSTVTTIAPTGTISIIAGSSSGIEPLFAIAYQHIVKDKHLDRTLTFINPKFEEVAKEKGFWSKEIEDKVADHGTIRDIEEIPEDVREVFGTSHEIHHDWHIKTQAAFQKYTENAVSKTINMRNEVAVDEVKESYLLAWETNCNGITIFRDGCKDAQVLNLGTGKEKGHSNGVVDHVISDEPKRERPMIVNGSTYKLLTPVGKAYIIINEDAAGLPIEVFVNVGKAGSDLAAMAEALGRVISTSLRFRGTMDPKERAYEIADQLAGIGGRRSVGFGPTKILSLPDAVAAALSMHYKFNVNGFGKVLIDNNEVVAVDEGHTNGNGTIKSMVSETQADVNQAVDVLNKINDNPDGQTHMFAQATSINIAADICPNCGANALVYQEGCVKCHSCGHSEC